MVKYDENGLVSAIIQDNRGNVLMLAYMNEDALNKTLQTGETWIYDRQSGEVWKKGFDSGNTQKVRRISADCNRETILITVDQCGLGACDNACDDDRYSCFHNLIMSDGPDRRDLRQQGEVLSWLYASIEDRRRTPKIGSYTNYLMENGLDKILKAFGEESAEVIIAGKNEGDEELVYEASDLLYHLLVLLVYRKIDLETVWEELRGRTSLSGN